MVPFFYSPVTAKAGDVITLDEETSRHVVQVLRMQSGEQLKLTDGKGAVQLCEVEDDHKRHCTVVVRSTSTTSPNNKNITIGVSLLKNTSRYEWFLEKATEIGVNRIVPLICERTEKQKFRSERMRQIVISAMLQSQQAWLPLLEEPMKFSQFVTSSNSSKTLNLIAHCETSTRVTMHEIVYSSGNICIVIGPEGDFTTSEIDLSVKANFQPVSLGNTRLRSETAAVVALALLNNQ